MPTGNTDGSDAAPKQMSSSARPGAGGKGRRKQAARLRRCIQAGCLVFFLVLLSLAVAPLPQSLVPVDLFLRLDPSVALVVPLAVREWIAALWPGVVVLLVAIVAGRLFCGYVCPMGTSIDLAGFVGKGILGKSSRSGSRGLLPSGKDVRDGKDIRADRGKDTSGLPIGFRHMKYLLLAVLLGAGLLGLNLCFWLSPIPLITRFYALLAHPLLTQTGNEALLLAQPLLGSLDIPSLSYLQVAVRRFSSVYFLLFFFGALFILEQVRPRFWCRYLCPAGALLGLLSLKALWRRRVLSCTTCGRCARDCPTGAIHPQGRPTDEAECITCRNCTDVCPVGGTVFSFTAHIASNGRLPADDDGAEKAEGRGPATVGEDRRTPAGAESAVEDSGRQQTRQAPGLACLPTRRHFLAAACMGAGLAGVGFSSLHSLLREDQKGLLWSEFCVRPPGALPEKEFLGRCLRCGECMKVCPTNGLQPTWFTAGVEGMFSPVLVSRRGPCEPDCNACGHVCPTGALSPLPLEEKHWAKIGTAVVIQGYCLAWAENRSCVVCEEVCPYGAIKCERQAATSVPVPVVRAERCFGCGYCEQHCPVRVPAIVVRPLNALRLHGTEYKKAAIGMGLSLIPGSKEAPPGYPPDEPLPGGLPPGFSE